MKRRNMLDKIDEIYSMYDFIKIKNKIYEIFALFDYLKMVDSEVNLPSITNSYQVRYEQFLPEISSSKVENFVFREIAREIRGSDYEQRKLLTKITVALRNLSKEEKEIFKYCYFEEKTIEEIEYSFHSCSKIIKQYIKRASISFIINLGLDRECFKTENKNNNRVEKDNHTQKENKEKFIDFYNVNSDKLLNAIKMD